MESATPPPQLTVKAILLGIVLSMVLAGANAYLGLFAGMTVSASIPAAVISMAILKMFKNSNILENNIVQTAASAGESIAAGVIFTLQFRAWSQQRYRVGGARVLGTAYLRALGAYHDRSFFTGAFRPQSSAAAPSGHRGAGNVRA